MFDIAKSVMPQHQLLRAEITPVIEESDPAPPAAENYGDILYSILDTLGVSDSGFGAYFGRGRINLLRYPVLFRCIDVIQNSISILDHYITDKDEKAVKMSELNRSNGSDARTIQAFYDVMLDRPDGSTLFSDYIRQTVGDLCFDGNAYWIFKLDSKGDLEYAEMAGSSTAVIDYTSTGAKIYRLQSISEGYKAYLANQVLHIVKNRMRQMYASLNTETRSYTHEFGISPVFSCSKATRTGITSDNYVAEFFSTNFASTIVLSSEKKMTSDQMKYLEERLVSNRKTRRPLVLTGGFEVNNITNEPQGENVQELRDFQVTDVARAFGVPPPLIGQNISQWGSGLESLFRMMVNWCLRPYTSAISQHLSLLLPDGYNFKFNTEELKKGDYQSLSNILKEAAVYITRDEGRKMLGLPGEGKDFEIAPTLPPDPNSAPPVEES